MSSARRQRDGVASRQRTPPLPALKAAALGSAPFVLPTVPVRVGQFWTFDRVDGRYAVAARRSLCRRTCCRTTRTSCACSNALGRARRARGRRRVRPCKQQRNLELTWVRFAGRYRATRPCALLRVAELAREAVRRTRPISRSAVLLDLYAGTNSRYLNFYGPARAIQTRAVRPRAHGFGEIDLAGKVLLVGMSEPRQPRAAGRLLFGVLAEHRHQSERRRGRRRPSSANLLEQRTLAAAAAAVARRARRRARRRVRLARRRGSAMLRAAGVAALGGAALYFARRVLAVHELRTSGCRSSCRCSCSCRSGFGVAVWWNYRELAVQRERVRTALGYYVPQSRRAAAHGADVVGRARIASCCTARASSPTRNTTRRSPRRLRPTSSRRS